MVKDTIWEGFIELFPEFEKRVESYTKIGSKSLKLKLKPTEDAEPKYLIFLYNSPDDWTFGSTIWRRKPIKNFHKEDTNNEVKADNIE